MVIHIRQVMVAFTLFAFSCSNDTETTNKLLAHENTRLRLQLDSLYAHVDSITHELPYAENAGNEVDLLSGSDINFFKRKGLANPVEAIKADLIKNNQLIPVQGNLGGTMRFYKERIQILNRQWVLAYFEDGHSAGEMLLEYKVNNTGNISWKVLSVREM